MNLYLVRHGETNENAAGIVQGWLDTDLNETGLQQAQEAAIAFDKDIDAIFASDLQRSVQTAAYFRNKYPNLPYFEDARLRERNFGDAQGSHRDTQDWEGFWSATDATSIPNAETLREFNRRVQSFLTDIRKFGHQAILVVSHSGTTNRILDLTSENHVYQPIKNADAIRTTY